ncbi:hypothetical protein C7974DRAFT_394317 [Boeremia exigua]|uniref:uncharacterized protein n=1 Tax=Boeremia exigua TaxID=749465 RepID=UPI001E8CAB7A|nr:uncharacterized protein C7974DRAFT_394317 [Boeremia exigua]KAH6629365.1 hypothetical protein C7974DRAFT_394317 [Boeremia exigua]
MSSFTRSSPAGLPQSPRATRPMLLPIDTSCSPDSTTPYSSSETLASQSQTPITRHRSAESLIFANATIPLSPASSISNESNSDTLLEGLRPRRRNGFARFFCCFGREERARRRVMMATQYEKVGEKAHWTEY